MITSGPKPTQAMSTQTDALSSEKAALPMFELKDLMSKRNVVTGYGNWMKLQSKAAEQAGTLHKIDKNAAASCLKAV